MAFAPDERVTVVYDGGRDIPVVVLRAEHDDWYLVASPDDIEHPWKAAGEYMYREGEPRPREPLTKLREALTGLVIG